MSARRSYAPHLSFVLVATLAATTFSMFAQGPPAGTPPGAPPAPAPQGTTPPDAGRGGQGAADAGRGRGGGGRGGGPSLGGIQSSDPIYEAQPDFFAKKPPVLPLAPEEQARKFLLPQGFKMEPVLTDPNIEEAAQIAFDGNGRMFVLEIRGYMQDADGNGTLAPVGRISRHEDRDNDGKYETHTVFVDKLIFPRFVMPFGANAILAKESNADELWKYTDTDNDGKADKQELFTTGFGRLANVEHQESMLMWGMDNWLYSTYNQFRVRWTPGGILREPTGLNGAQWGVTQDNYGKPWFQSGASGMPGYFQTPVVYGNFANPEQFEPNLNITWGAPVLIADMQGGMNSVRMPDGSLSRATAGAGNDVYRGDRLPKDMIGDYFYGESVARIVRRLRPVKTEGLTQLRNVYPLSEFIRSTDPLFRPVDMTTAPDGTMYITDMYRGIIQESQWSGRGTYLRARIEQYSLDKVVRHGRIWRLSYEGMGRRTTPPRMLNETPAQLVAHFNDGNGWWRDTAQQLLVLAQDKSVVPALKAMAQKSPNQLARIHALWTLEGLNAADAALLRPLFKDADSQIRQTAVRVSESLYKTGDKSFGNDYKALTTDADPEVVMQALMTLNVLKVAGTPDTAKAVSSVNKARGVQVVANNIVSGGGGGGRGGGGGGAGAAPLSPADQAAMDRGRTIYTELCFSCHGDDGRGQLKEGSGLPQAPPLAGSTRVTGHRDYSIKVLLHGLTGPMNNTSYTDVMIPMGQNNDEWVAAIASYVRNSFGNRAPMITAADVARVRQANSVRKTSWTVSEIEASMPRQVPVDASWKLTASHNAAIASYALSTQPWTSGLAQQPGMWLQVELPQAVMLTELQFDSNALAVNPDPIVPGGPPRSGGGAGRGGAAAGPPPTPGFPRGFKVEVSMDGTSWGSPVAEGRGDGTSTTITFAPARAKFVRLTQTATVSDPVPMTVLRLKLYEAGK